jgi:hypothetical protein
MRRQRSSNFMVSSKERGEAKEKMHPNFYHNSLSEILLLIYVIGPEILYRLRGSDRSGLPVLHHLLIYVCSARLPVLCTKARDLMPGCRKRDREKTRPSTGTNRGEPDRRGNSLAGRGGGNPSPGFLPARRDFASSFLSFFRIPAPGPDLRNTFSGQR